jgi:hypothetical protein
MRLKDVIVEGTRIDEIVPVIGAVAGGAVKAAGAIGKAALQGGAALARGVGSAMASGTQAAGQAAAGQAAAGLAGGAMDPVQAAQAAKQRTEQKKQIQDAIRAKQQELTDLQKQLAALG